MLNEVNETFGDVIHKYTRGEAIDDGVLIDVPVNKLAKQAGITWHCAITAALFTELQPLKSTTERTYCEDFEGVLWDMLTIFKLSVKQKQSETKALLPGMRWTFKILRQNRRYTSIDVVFSVEEMNGKNEPCWTFMLPKED